MSAHLLDARDDRRTRRPICGLTLSSGGLLRSPAALRILFDHDKHVVTELRPISARRMNWCGLCNRCRRWCRPFGASASTASSSGLEPARPMETFLGGDDVLITASCWLTLIGYSAVWASGIPSARCWRQRHRSAGARGLAGCQENAPATAATNRSWNADHRLLVEVDQACFAGHSDALRRDLFIDREITRAPMTNTVNTAAVRNGPLAAVIFACVVQTSKSPINWR